MDMVAMGSHPQSSHAYSLSIASTHQAILLTEKKFLYSMSLRRNPNFTPILTFTATARQTELAVVFCISSSLSHPSRNARLMTLPQQRAFNAPGRATRTKFSGSLVSSKPAVSIGTTSFLNHVSGSSAEQEHSKPGRRPAVSDPSLIQFKSITLEEVKKALQSNRKRRLKYFTHLAGWLASDGHMLEFADFLKMLADAGMNKEIFTTVLDSTRVDAGMCLLLVQRRLDVFVTVMKRLTKAGYEGWQFAGKGSRGLLADELLKLLASRKCKYCVHIMQSLSECGFLVKKLVDPARVIACCAKSRDLQTAHSYVNLLSRNPWHYNLMIREFGYYQELQLAFSVLDIMKEEGVAADLFTYRALIDSCGRGNEPSKANVVFESMLKDGLKPNVFIYNSIMNVNVGDMEEVHRYYQHMQDAGVTADLTTFNILLKACGTTGRPDLAVDFYYDVQQRRDLTMDVVTYSTLINVFGRAKMWGEALQVKVDMLAAGVTPNVVTWTSLIGACAIAGLVEQSFREFEEMLIAGCSPNVNCYNMLLHACVKASQYERAFQLFEEWKQTGRICSFIDLINNPDQRNLNSTEEENQCEPVMSAAENPKQKTQSPRCQPNLVTYNTLIKACGPAPERARALMEEMKGLGIVADLQSWSILMDAYGSKGDLEACLDTLDEMKVAGIIPDVIAYTAVIKGCVQAGEPDKAFDFFNQMKAAGVRPNVVTYNTLLRAQRNYGKFQEVQQALAVYEEMREAGYAPNDFLLQGLLKEWAEGVSNMPKHLQENMVPTEDGNPEKGISEYTEALLQKVAVHARSGNEINDLVIDLHGLSKGEARIAVLAVLRIIKERHILGNSIKEDLIIITGMGHRSEIKGVSVVKEVVLRVLQKELCLPVISASLNNPCQVSDAESKEVIETDTAGSAEKCDANVSTLVAVRQRKPFNSGRLRVTKEALTAWLGRKSQSWTGK